MRKTKLFRCMAFFLAVLVCLGTGLTAAAVPETNDIPQYTNVAYRKNVTATSIHPETTYFSTEYLTDGINVDLSENSHVGWSTAVGLTENDEVDVIVELDGEFMTKEVAVFPMAWESGKFFPASYEVSVSLDGTEWTKVGEALV